MKTCYYYQGSVLLYTTDSNGNKTSQNIIGLQDNIIATIRYEEDGQAAYFYNKDIRTSVSNVVDDAGLGVVSYKYDDYGTTIKYGRTDFYNDICYTSGVYDELTGLYYLNARYYNPETFTFITQDSYRGEKNDHGTWNMYAYCGGNPIMYVDPSGHIAITASVAGYYAFSALVSAGVTVELYNMITRTREYTDELYLLPKVSQVQVNVNTKSTTVAKKKLKVVTMSAEHTKNKRKSTYDKHTKPRSGRQNEKKKLKKNWKRRK